MSMGAADGGAGAPGGELSLLRAVFDVVDAGLYVLDRQGRIALANTATTTLLGYDEATLLGASAHELFHTIDATGRRRPADRCPIARVAGSGVADSADSDVFVRADGRLLPVAWTSAPIVDGGVPAGAVVIFHDASLRPGAAGDDPAADEPTGEVPVVPAAGEPPEVGGSVEAEARAEAQRTAFLTDATLALLSTLDVDEALARLARIVVPRFADWCAVHLLGDDGVVRRVTVAHREPGRVRALGGAVEAGTPLPDPPGPPLARVLRGAPSALIDSWSLPAPDDPAVSELERQQDALFARLGARQALVVRLPARSGTAGALTLVRERGRFRRPERALAEDLALRAGIAVENARLFTDTRSTAEALQRSMLPALPRRPGLHLAGAYVPAGHGAEIGGDWYDAFPLGDGVTGIALGDVAGHDLQAAAHMGDIRNLLRGASLASEDPGEVLCQLDRAMGHFLPGVTATAVYGRIGPVDGRQVLHWSSAGHLPPLLLGADGATSFLDDDPDPLLGLVPELAAHPRRTHALPLDPGTMVVLYSDGLVEERDGGVEPGLSRLRRAAGRLAPEGPAAVAEHLVSELDRESADDIAILVVAAR